MNVIEKFRHCGLAVKIVIDPDPEDPSEYNFGKITYRKGSRYILGNEPVDEYRKQEIANGFARGELVGMPVFAYVHSGSHIVAAHRNPFHCPWDSAQSGFVYSTMERVLDEFGTNEDKLSVATGGGLTKNTIDRVLETMKAEVKTFDQYLNGEVYGVVIEKDGKELDSLWGIFDLVCAHKEGKSMAFSASKRIERERASLEAHAMVTV
jgi:hypothetical protein